MYMYIWLTWEGHVVGGEGEESGWPWRASISYILMSLSREPVRMRGPLRARAHTAPL